MINQLKFNLEMIKKFEAQYPQLPTDILIDIIDVVLNRAPSVYFSSKDVEMHPEFCAKCGICCKNLNCEYFNGKTCDEYESRYDSCMDFPSYDINNETGLMLECECSFAKKLAETVLDKEIKRNMELLF